MKYKLLYSQQSLKDLDRIWSEVFEASQDLDITENYITDLRAAIRSKSDFPESGAPLIFLGEPTGVYFVTFKAYIAFYRIRGDRMEVGRILFSRSDYMKILFGRSEYNPEDGEE